VDENIFGRMRGMLEELKRPPSLMVNYLTVVPSSLLNSVVSLKELSVEEEKVGGRRGGGGIEVRAECEQWLMVPAMALV